MQIQDMPVLRPIPIETREKNRLVALINWIFRIRKWRLEEDWTFTFPDGRAVVIPRGFELDGASVPRIFWLFLSPTGLLLIPAILHDFAYENHYLPERRPDGTAARYGEGEDRGFWDRMFREVAIHVNGLRISNTIAWMAVVLFGWLFFWKRPKRKPAVPTSDLDGAE